MYYFPRPQQRISTTRLVAGRVGPRRDDVAHGRRAPPQEEQGVARVERVGRDDLVLVVPAAVGLLALDQELGAFAEPPVAADLLEEPQGAHPLDAVEVVEVARLALVGVLVDRPVGREPREAVVDALVDLLVELLPERLADD